MSKYRCLGIGCSPRPEGNTAILLEKAMEAALNAGAEIKTVYLRELCFSPCVACNGCFKAGQCVLKDDMQQLYRHMLEADCIILAAPIFSMGINALGKALIDRAQRFWATKYVLRQPVITEQRPFPREGIYISVAGSNLPQVFDGALQTVKYWYLMLECKLAETLLYTKIDDKGDILKHPDKLAETYHQVYTLIKGNIDKNPER